MGRPEYDAHDVKNIAMRQEWCYVKTFWKDYGRMITFLRDGVQINIYLRSGNIAMCLENDREGKSHQTRKKINTKSKLGNLLMNPGVTYKQLTMEEAEESLCKYYKTNKCRYGERCVYVHASPCNQCGRNRLHPTHKPQEDFIGRTVSKRTKMVWNIHSQSRSKRKPVVSAWMWSRRSQRRRPCLGSSPPALTASVSPASRHGKPGKVKM